MDKLVSAFAKLGTGQWPLLDFARLLIEVTLRAGN